MLVKTKIYVLEIKDICHEVKQKITIKKHMLVRFLVLLLARNLFFISLNIGKMSLTVTNLGDHLLTLIGFYS